MVFVGFLFSGCDDAQLTGPTKDSNNDIAKSCTTPVDCGGASCINGKCQASTTPTNNQTQPNNQTSNNQTGETCAKRALCGSCDVSCQVGTVGPSSGTPFDIAADGSGGVVLDADGHITLEAPGTAGASHYVWIANTGQGTISKVDSRTYEEVARYLTGPHGTSNDPSRTSVNNYSDVYVGNRSGMSVTKIANGANCRDRSGDGIINTSTGANDVKPFGQDDCVLWNTPLTDGGIIRAIAAQDGSDGPVVWVGGWNGVIWKLDGETGQILVRTTAPHAPYGFALDKAGNLWIATYPNSRLARLDTNRCTDSQSCNAEPVCDDTGDTCVKQIINLPAGAYGITVDFKQRVWLGGNLMRYDPAAPPGQRIVLVNPGAFIHGIAADDKGWIYGAGYNQGMYRVEADNPNNWAIVAGTAQQSVKGIAVDLDGKAWGINYGHNNALVVQPGAGLNDGQVIHTQAGFVSPYTYSDMTGSQLRFATNRRGIFVRTFEGCAPAHFVYNEWEELHFTSDVPAGATITMRVRVANARDQLAQAEWIDVAELPSTASPVNLKAILEPLNLHRSQFIQVESQLNALSEGDVVAVPVLKSLSVRSECPPILL